MAPKDDSTSETDPGVVSTNESDYDISKLCEQYTCSTCKLSFRRKDALDRHEFKHTGVKKFVCSHPGCNKSYSNKAHLVRHSRSNHQPSSGTEAKVKCLAEDCLLEYQNKYAMMKHYKLKHSGQTKIIKCEICERIFHRKSKLRAHLFEHTKIYPYNCNNCKKGFLYQYNLSRHSCRNGYQCDDCKKEFLKWSDFHNHRKQEHISNRRCAICNKSFIHKKKFEMHMATHQNHQERTVFSCPIAECEKYYFTRSGLNEHIKVIHKHKNYPCSVAGCSSSLTSKRKLELHVERVHSNVEPSIPKPTKNRKKRRDCDKPKKSFASILSGVINPPEVEKLLISGQGSLVEVIDD